MIGGNRIAGSYVDTGVRALILVCAAACSAPAPAPATTPAPAAPPAPAPARVAPPPELPAPPPLDPVVIDPPAPLPPAPVAKPPPAPPPAPDHSARLRTVDAEIVILRRLLKASGNADRVDVGLRLADHLGERANLAPGDGARFEADRASLLATLAADAALANDPRMDEVLAALGTALMASDPKQARLAFARLIKNYPASKHVPAAFLSFAEYYFDQGQLANARKFYEKVVQFPGADVALYARYKMAWVDLNLGDQARALEGFVKVVQTASRGPQRPTDANLARQAARDMVQAYAAVGRADRAAPFFARILPGDLAPLERLATAYDDMGKAAEAITVWTDLAARHADHEHRCRWELGRARSFAMVMKPDDEVAAVAAAIAAGTRDPQCEAEARHHGRTVARAWHREWSHTRLPAQLARALAMYTEILRGRPDGLEAAVDRFYASHILWRRAAGATDPGEAAAAWSYVAGSFAMAADALAGDPRGDRARDAATRAANHARAIADAFGLEIRIEQPPAPLDLAAAPR